MFVMLRISLEKWKTDFLTRKATYMEVKLGKIKDVYFGFGGYQECMIGINFTLEGKEGCWGVGTSKVAWDKNIIKCDKFCKWTEKDRSKQYDEIVRYISDLLKDAKVSKIEDLKNVPVEVTFDSNQLKSWRILKEVL
jgi:hypothetical protein